MEKKYTAKNGIEIYTYKNPSLHGFYISVFVRAGSMYEDSSECGITHFLEHVLVRNVNKVRGGKLYSELDKHAMEFNASTYAEMVQFYVSGASEKFRAGSEIIASIFNPIMLTAQEIDTERQRIKAEIREADDKNSLANFTAEAVFSGTSLSSSILGTNRSVDRISGKKLENYRKKVFTPKNIFLYVTGNFDDRDITELSDRLSAVQIDTAGQMLPKRDNIAPVPVGFGNRDGAVHVKNADFTMLRFTFDVDMAKVPSAVLDLIYDMLLSGYNSPFFIEMSEERGLFYDISGATERYCNIGTVYFSYEVKEKNIYDAAQLSIRILNEFKNKTYPDDECMKGGYVDNSKLLYDDARESGFTLAYDNHVMRLGYRSIEERAQIYKKISGEDIRRAACEIFTPENLTLTVKGKKKSINTEKLRNIIKELS